MSKINARSPYYITLTATNLTQVDMELYVYTGTQTTDRTNLFTLTSFAINNVGTSFGDNLTFKKLP